MTSRLSRANRFLTSGSRILLPLFVNRHVTPLWDVALMPLWSTAVSGHLCLPAADPAELNGMHAFGGDHFHYPRFPR